MAKPAPYLLWKDDRLDALDAGHAHLVELFVAGLESGHDAVPVPFDVRAVGVQLRFEPVLGEDLLAYGDIARQRKPDPERDDADIGDGFHGWHLCA